MLVVTVSVTALTVFSFFSISQNTNRLVGEELALVGGENITRAAETIQGRVAELEVLSLSPNIVAQVQTGNLDNASLTAADIAALDNAWKDEDPAVETLVAGIQENEVSAYLRQFMAKFPGEIEVFVTDARGLNVAMTERTGDYLQADEGWWTSAYHDGAGQSFIDEVEYDDTANSYAMNIATPVRDERGALIGVLRGTVDVSVIFDTLSQLRVGETGEAILLDANGVILYASDGEWLMSEPLLDLGFS